MRTWPACTTSTHNIGLAARLIKYGDADVINAGIGGYSAYNELHYYLNMGRGFEPDIVIAAFCMNDVVNPRLHWGPEMCEILDISDQDGEMHGDVHPGNVMATADGTHPNIIRDEETGHKRFRELATEITKFLCYEALKHIKTREVDVETPLATARCSIVTTSGLKACSSPPALNLSRPPGSRW